MQLVRQIRACFITFILLISSLSLFIIPAEDTKADDISLEEFLLILTGFHPYITAGVFVNEANESLHVKGDVVFDLYYSSTFSSQWKYKDDIKVSLYTFDETFIPKVIDYF